MSTSSSSYLTSLFSLAGKVAVVIGGTGELCGAMAEGLAGAGAEVVLVGRNEEKAKPRLERRFPHTLAVSFQPEGGAVAAMPTARTGPGVSDHRITLDFVADVRGTPADAAESALLADACTACGEDRDLSRDLNRDLAVVRR